jgi:hypothetical protein
MRAKLEQTQFFPPSLANVLDKVHRDQLNSWAYPWLFTNLVQSGLTIIPSRNLISNIGFGADATHTTDTNSQLANKALTAMDFPMVHPPYIMPNLIYQKEIIRLIHRSPTLAGRLRGRLRSLLKRVRLIRS